MLAGAERRALMKVLVTGIAGFIGSHLAEGLLARGDDVVGLDNFDSFYGRGIKERNLRRLRGRAAIVEADILDRGALDRVLAMSGFDAVVHLAALAGVRPSIREPSRYQEVNVLGTTRLAEALHAAGVGRLVFASSSSVYGHNVAVPYAEDQPVDRPASPYAASKRGGELLLSTLSELHGITVSCLRYFTVYGPRQRPEMAIHSFCRLLEAGETIPMFGQGDTSRDYTYVDDAVAGTIAALDRAPAGFSIYNIGNTRPVTLRDLVAHIGRALGKEPRVEHQPLQPGDVAHTWASIERAERDLSWRPVTSIETGLERFVAWLRHPD